MARDSRQPKPETTDNAPNELLPPEEHVEQLIVRMGGFWRNSVAPYWRVIVAVILAMVVVALAVRLVQRRQTARIARAWQQVSFARAAEEAVHEKSLKRIAEENKTHIVAQVAAFRLAKSTYADGDYEKALDQFNAFLKQYPESPLRTEARLGQAYSLESNGQYELAAETFTDVAEASDSDIVVAQAYLGAGRCYQEAGNIEDARAAFENAHANAARSMFGSAALDALKALDANG